MEQQGLGYHSGYITATKWYDLADHGHYRSIIGHHILPVGRPATVVYASA